MAKRYRISIPMTDDGRHAIRELADATGSSMGTATADFLDEMAPHILQLAEVIRGARKDPKLGVEMLNKMADEARGALDEEQLELIKKVNE